ncbi:MAG: alpha/beta fold hydrolase [Bacteroidales bacterium]|nr:alpha/beta fold hydrolase [Bacteroidales bacterium]
MEQHKTIKFEGHTLHYRDEGREHEQTLVLLHGYLQNLDVWSPYVLSFMRSMHVITIDLPGHGYSDCVAEVHTMDLMARTVKAVLDDAGVKQCVLVGHSMGGYVALAFAEMYPHCLRGLGLLHSHAYADDDATVERRMLACEEVTKNRARYIVGFIPPLFDPSKRIMLAQEIKDLQDQCLETKEESVVAAQRGMAERPARIGVLYDLEVPVLFIFGRNDSRLPIEKAVAQTLDVRHAEILILDGVAHMSHIEDREYVRPRIANFVSTCYL